ncbi:cytochrome ubiquinol oxidase subunit I [Amycolatopsis taiwanensis]|uniref:Cytochrome ubiquinol oxidase subunit I n=1 Tax=Amycolatopsis taiwanensis TaxID=342230 RepID=A0A9W6R6A6_9PSEU|nr:cytochrome ubiquinol oxidase subunit I [Amycolatopsis taiwanensis]GLY69869.1 cytochrome ubiquinol oxidase subunit I [Amycolatopsis taiwanensis]
MNAVDLSRLQFATTTSFHFLFVLLTLGLVTLVTIMQTRHTIGGKPELRRMTRFWGKLYVINYALGIATGIVMEFQFGLNWTGVSAVAGDIFGAPLAIETLVAFFLESTFLGLWIFGWDRMNKWLHLTLIWLVAITAYASAFWIMVANSFLQNPAGTRREGNVLRLTDFGALLSNPTLRAALPHVLFAALLAGGMFVVGVSAYHFIKRTTEVEFFRRSMRLGVLAAAIAAPFVMFYGFNQFELVRSVQPAKFGDGVPPELLQAWTARFGPGDYAPASWTGWPLGLMIAAGSFLLMVIWATAPLLFRNWLFRVNWLRPVLYLMVAGTPVPFVVAIFGWLAREGGRQPWVIYGELLTRDAVAGLPASQVLVSYVGFTALFATLAVADWVLLSRIARRGPEPGRPAVDNERPHTLVLSGV